MMCLHAVVSEVLVVRTLWYVILVAVLSTAATFILGDENDPVSGVLAYILLAGVF